jgi:hypothetical protein
VAVILAITGSMVAAQMPATPKPAATDRSAELFLTDLQRGAEARDGTRIWTGRVPASADYRVDVIDAAADSHAVKFVLAINVRQG